MAMAEKIRCSWCGSDPLYVQYHDEEWGVPEHNDERLFEMICLEGAQAGLSWITILRKRENYRKAFSNFDAVKMSRIKPEKVEKLMLNEGIVRNRLKINAFITNAKAYLATKDEFGSFNDYIWSFVEGKPLRHDFSSGGIPARTELSDRMSKDLLKRGFKFTGSTICYAFMQACGLTNDHSPECFRSKLK